MSHGRARPLDVVQATARRDWTTRRSYQFNFVFDIAGRLTTILSFFFMSKLVGDAPSLDSTPYFEFALLGLLVFNGATVALGTVKRLVTGEGAGGTLEILLTKPTSVWPVAVGSFVVPAAFFLVEVVLTLAIAVALGADFSAAGLAASIPILFLVLVAFGLLGFFAAGFIVLTKRGDIVSFAIANGTNLLAGAFFPVVLLPEGLRAISHVIPAFHALEAIRALSLDGAGVMDVADSCAYLLVIIVATAPMALGSLAHALRIARRTGTLGAD